MRGDGRWDWFGKDIEASVGPSVKGAQVTSRGRLPGDLGTPACGVQWGDEDLNRGVVLSAQTGTRLGGYVRQSQEEGRGQDSPLVLWA